MKAIRGAHTAAANTAEAIEACTLELLRAMLAENNLAVEEITAVIFTATRDLDAAYPAKFARELAGWEQVPLFCVQEMHVAGSLCGCIRVLIFTERAADAPVQHVYLGGAKALRPDLSH